MKRFIGIGAILLTVMVSLGVASSPIEDGTVEEQSRTQAPLIGKTIADVLRNENLQAFRVAVQTTRLTELFSNRGAYTLFVPTNEAFSIVAQGQLKHFISGEGGVLAHHIVEGVLTIEVLRAMLRERGGQMSLPTLAGTDLGITLDENGAIIVGGVAGIVAEGEIVANGVVLPIDNVLTPSTLVETAKLCWGRVGHVGLPTLLK